MVPVRVPGPLTLSHCSLLTPIFTEVKMMLQAMHFIINKFAAALVKPLHHWKKNVT